MYVCVYHLSTYLCTDLSVFFYISKYLCIYTFLYVYMYYKYMCIHIYLPIYLPTHFKHIPAKIYKNLKCSHRRLDFLGLRRSSKM